MDIKEKYYDLIRKKNFRLTKYRIAIIEVLENKHLTFKELQDDLKKKGFNNLASLYNNLDFLISLKIVVELYINNTKYYDLSIENPGHSNESNIHIILNDSGKIFEINDEDIFDYIRKHSKLKNLNLDHIRIIISASGK